MKLAFSIASVATVLAPLVWAQRPIRVPNLNEGRIEKLNELSTQGELTRLDNMLAWDRSIAILANPPDPRDTIKYKSERREMKQVVVGQRRIKCTASGPMPESEQELIKGFQEFQKIRSLRVTNLNRGLVDFEVFDNGQISKKTLRCIFSTLENGKPIRMEKEKPLKTEELIAYIQEQNRLQLISQTQELEAEKKYLEERAKREAALKAELQKDGKSLADLMGRALSNPLFRSWEPTNTFDRLYDESRDFREFRRLYQFPHALSDEDQERTSIAKPKAEPKKESSRVIF